MTDTCEPGSQVYAHGKNMLLGLCECPPKPQLVAYCTFDFSHLHEFSFVAIILNGLVGSQRLEEIHTDEAGRCDRQAWRSTLET